MNNLEFISDLKSGATVQQKASLYRMDDVIDYKSSDDLDYLDIINLTLALNILSEFYDVNACVLVKNNSLTGVSLGATLFDSFKKAIDCNPVDAICGVVGFSKSPTEDIIKLLTPQHLVVAYNIDDEAEEFLKALKIRYVNLLTPLNQYKNYLKEEVVSTPFGLVMQEKNKSELDKDLFKVVSLTKPNVEQVEDAIFAWKITKYIKSAGIVISKDFKTIGISQGLQSVSFEHAINNSCDTAKEAVLATDIPLSVHDLNVLAQNRVSLIIQPGVTKDVLKQADKFNIALITTGISNFSLY